MPVASRLIVWSSILSLVLACGTEPDDEPIVGNYGLTAVDDRPLPHLLDDSDPNCEVYVSHGELVIAAAASYRLEFWGPYNCIEGQTGELGRFYNGTYARTGNSLSFTAEISGYGTLEFNGSIGTRAIEVTVPPIPPGTGPDLTLDFELVP
jgi:hypothetical protein